MNAQPVSANIDCDVLIVGLGPVGATTAALLSARGHSVVAVERERGIYPLPRAVGFDGDIMRIFQAMNLHEVVEPHTRFSPYYDFLAADGSLLLSYDRAKTVHHSGWRQNVTFFQPAVEEALRRQAVDTGLTRTILGAAFVGASQDEESVIARVSSGESPNNVRARYLVGCDGARSQVRSAMGVELYDYGFNEPWLVVDFLANDLSGLPDRNVQICDPERPATYMQMGPGRYRWEFMILPDDDVDTIQSPDTIAHLLAERGVTRRDPIERSALYRFHGRLADNWRTGRMLLAGDAAHQMPPFAGQGFCSGLRDAFSLCWMLDLVLQGKASETLLDAYTAERKPQVAFMIESAIRLGRIVCTTDPHTAMTRNAAMFADREAGRTPPPLIYPPLATGFFLVDDPAAGELFPQPVATIEGKTLRFDDLAGGKPAIILRSGTMGEEIDAGGFWVGSLDAGELSPFAGAIERWLDAHGVDAVLVRPDFYVFGTGRPVELIQSYRQTLTGTRDIPQGAESRTAVAI